MAELRVQNISGWNFYRHHHQTNNWGRVAPSQQEQYLNLRAHSHLIKKVHKPALPLRFFNNE